MKLDKQLINELKEKYGDIYEITLPQGDTFYLRKLTTFELKVVFPLLMERDLEGQIKLLQMSIVYPQMTYEQILSLPPGKTMSLSEAVIKILEIATEPPVIKKL